MNGKKLRTCNNIFFAEQKRFIAGSLIFLLISFNSINAYSASLSATLALGDALSIAGGGGVVGTILAPEVIIPMALVALGIAGIGYVAKSNAVEEIAEELKDNYSEWVVLEGGGGNNNKRPFLKGWYKAGKVFLSEVLIGIIAKIAIDKGLFDGVKTTNEYGYDLSNYNDNGLVNINGFANINDQINYILYYLESVSYPTYDRVKNIAGNLKGYINSELGNITNLYGQVTLDTNSNDYLYVYILDNINLPMIGTVNSSVTGDHANYKVINLNNQISYTRYDSGGDFENYGAVRMTTGNLNSIRAGYNFTFYSMSNGRGNFSTYPLGLYHNIDNSGIPITNNVPSINNDEVILPNWNNNPSIEPDPVGSPGENALPVSLPEGYDLPLIFPPEYPDELPENLNIPNYEWPDNLPDDPNYPDPSAQPEAQEGLGVSTPIVNDPFSDIQKESFLLPENIINKFPFCIPYDMVKCVRSLSAERSAPIYTWNYNIAGMSGSVNLDLSRFNEAATVFRTCELAVFVIGLIVSTKKIIEV